MSNTRSTVSSTQDLTTYMRQLGSQARAAAQQLRIASPKLKAQALRAMANRISTNKAQLQEANAKDLIAARERGLDAALLDRLTLSDRALEIMATGLRQIADMPDPVGTMGPTTYRPNGMLVAQMRVPIGVIGIIYESRPNVTIDAAALCLKSGNATILRGGSEAFHSNMALGAIIQASLDEVGLPLESVQVVDTTDRAAVGELIRLDEFVDVIIPRGGKSLIARLSAEATVPLLKHLDGNCHLYIDKDANPEKAQAIAINGKTYRYGICGATETLLVHTDIAPAMLSDLGQALTDKGVELRGCERTLAVVPQAKPATESDWETEFLGPILAIKIVDSIEQAMAHIQRYSSQHTESIVTDNLQAAQRFQREVDSSSVYINLPTCFADGFEYGLGAEIGISTNRLHARGPVGLEGLTTQKWVLTGNGQLRG